MRSSYIFQPALTALLLFAAVTTSTARSWRINGNKSAGADFVDINAACASSEVVDGDVLYLDPGCSLTSEQNVTKSLTIVGNGYFFTDQPYTPASISAKLNLKAAGIKVEGLNSSSQIYICADNVTIERCKATDIAWGAQGQYATIRQCWFSRVYGYGNTDTRSAYCTIENSFIRRENYDDYAVGSLRSPIIRNNYISMSYNYSRHPIRFVNGGEIANNIIMETKGNGSASYNYVLDDLTNCQVTNNVLSCDEGTYPAYPDNVCLGTNSTSSLFVAVGTGTDDRAFANADDSPAIAIEAGPFFGAHPYVFSGLPYGYPRFTKVAVSPRAENGKVNVSLNIQLQDE